jgi:hypothetical protein
VNLEGQPNWQARKTDGKLPAPPHDKTGHTWHHSTSSGGAELTHPGIVPAVVVFIADYVQNNLVGYPNDLGF